MLNIPQHSLHLMLVILAILVVGTLCYLWLSRRYPERDY
ncbi:phosphatidate cytidylyltransferase, partial [Vibrio cholerae]